MELRDPPRRKATFPRYPQSASIAMLPPASNTWWSSASNAVIPWSTPAAMETWQEELTLPRRLSHLQHPVLWWMRISRMRKSHLSHHQPPVLWLSWNDRRAYLQRRPVITSPHCAQLLPSTPSARAEISILKRRSRRGLSYFTIEKKHRQAL